MPDLFACFATENHDVQMQHMKISILCIGDYHGNDYDSYDAGRGPGPRRPSPTGPEKPPAGTVTVPAGRDYRLGT